MSPTNPAASRSKIQTPGLGAPSPQPSPGRPVPPPTASPFQTGPELNPDQMGTWATPEPGPETMTGAAAADVVDDVPRGRLRLNGRRTTSSPGDDLRGAAAPPSTVSVAEVAATIGEILLVLVGLGVWAAHKRAWVLRPPDEDERAKVADPLASILVRHAGIRFLNNDLVDGVKVAAGVAAYVETSPLSRADRPAEETDGPMPPGMEAI